MIVDWMEAKMKNIAAHERICSLFLDEVQISTAIQYDSGLKKFIEMIDDEFHPSSSTAPANHVLCFMAKGITLHWKQVVGKVVG